MAVEAGAGCDGGNALPDRFGHAVGRPYHQARLVAQLADAVDDQRLDGRQGMGLDQVARQLASHGHRHLGGFAAAIAERRPKLLAGGVDLFRYHRQRSAGGGFDFLARFLMAGALAFGIALRAGGREILLGEGLGLLAPPGSAVAEVLVEKELLAHGPRPAQ
jgi:hypothetical protein